MKTSIPRSYRIPLLGALPLLMLPLIIRNEYIIHMFVMIFIWAIAAMSYDLLVGYSGQASLGHAGLFSIGAYMSAALTRWYGISPWIALWLGAVASVTSSFAISIPSTRLRGPFLVITSLAFSEVWRIFVSNYAPLGGANGLFGYNTYEGIPAEAYLNKVSYYYLGLLFLLFAGVVMFFVGERTDMGLAFRTIRENDILAETLGIDVFYYKVMAFAISSFFAGLAGGLYAFYVLLVDPSTSMPWVTTIIITMSLAGGRSTIWGPILGAHFIVIMYESLRVIGIVYNLIAVGFVLMMIMLFAPKGLAGILRSK